MIAHIEATTLKAWLADGSEIALIDVREHGQYGAGHPFFAVPLPYSRFELGLADLVPNPQVRLVLLDAGDGVAARAAARAQALGYRNVHVLAGGAPAWSAAGCTLFSGVNVVSKTFGELVELNRHTPRVTAQALRAMQTAGENLVVVDGRPFAEYRAMNIPGGICCPNGELALRIAELAPDPRTKIVVNCAGRTRSIIGAQTLIDLGIPNPVYALENGTQGWFLAGLELERGATQCYPAAPPRDLAALKARAHAFAARHGVEVVSAATAQSWHRDGGRTTYLFDVRAPEEFAAGAVAGFRHAPGGQLIQATDLWVGVKGARLVLADAEGVRAPVVAGWLRQLGHEAYALADGIAAAAPLDWTPLVRAPELPAPPSMTAPALAAALAEDAVAVLDLRSSAAFRKGHIPGAVWSIRLRLAAIAAKFGKPLVLVADDPSLAALAALDLRAAGAADVRILASGQAAWRDAGLPEIATPDQPADADRIDFLFFVSARHDGDAEAARAYLAWEVALPDQLDAAERATFRI